MRGYMKRLLAILLCLGLVGCATTDSLTQISLGMTKEQVIQKIGSPTSVSAKGNMEIFRYYLYQPLGQGLLDTRRTDYFVAFQNGLVESYGKLGDFGTTAKPKEIIELDQKVTTNSTDNVENIDLESKLKTLNDLLSKGMITQADFDQQKKKLLDEYTNNSN